MVAATLSKASRHRIRYLVVVCAALAVAAPTAAAADDDPCPAVTGIARPASGTVGTTIDVEITALVLGGCDGLPAQSPDDLLDAVIDWADGTHSTATVVSVADEGDGSLRLVVTAGHTYTAPGTYIPTVTVTNQRLDRAQQAATFRVLEIAPAPQAAPNPPSGNDPAPAPDTADPPADPIDRAPIAPQTAPDSAPGSSASNSPTVRATPKRPSVRIVSIRRLNRRIVVRIRASTAGELTTRVQVAGGRAAPRPTRRRVRAGTHRVTIASTQKAGKLLVSLTTPQGTARTSARLTAR